MSVNGSRKDFLNTGILGGGAGVADKRGFRAIRTEYITSPDYDPKYFETFPTAWAAAYAFRKVLDLQVKPGTVSDNGSFVEEVSEAVEEWVTLFLLHYFGIVYLSESTQSELQQHYDRDLWLALSGTYPSEGAPRSIKLLQHDNTVLGAYYPAVIFFPARDRTTWLQDKTLEDYLMYDRLSWTRSRRILLTSEKEEHDFHTHLRSIAQHAMPSRSLQDRLYSFCEANFHERIDVTASLGSDPSKWEVPGLKNWPSDELLKIYPLVKPNKATTDGAEENAGKTFYLVDGLPEYSPWMKAALVSSGPAPYQYRRIHDRLIVVDLPGRRFECPLGENDNIVLLKDLFLTDTPH